MPSAPSSWKSRLGALAVVLALLIVVQPELRALLFLVDAIGLEVIALLLLTQLRTFWPLLQPAHACAARLLCGATSAVAGRALRIFPAVLPLRPMAFLLLPAFVLLPYSARCSLSLQARH
jgi:hypothetical protein